MMTDDAPIPLVDPADLPRPPTEPPNPAFAAVIERANRILRGDIHPEEYLPVTWVVQHRLEGELDCRRFLARRRDLDPQIERECLAQVLLHVHCLNQEVAYIQDERGVVILADGWDQIGEIMRHVSRDLWADRMRIEYPNDSIWV